MSGRDLVSHVLDVVINSTEVGGTKSTDGIPAVCGVVSKTLAAGSFSASCSTTNDILEGVRDFSGNLVEEWVDQSQSRFALVESEIVELGDKSSDEWARSRSSTDEGDIAVLDDEDVISDGSNIREATVGRVPELLRWLDDGGVGEVGSNSRGLVWWLSNEVRESTTSGEAGGFDGARDFLDVSGADAVGSGADWGCGVGSSLSGDEGGGANASDESRGGGEEWVEWVAGEGAVVVGWSRRASITAGGDNTVTKESDLGPFGFGSHDVVLGVGDIKGLAVAVNNVLLARSNLGPSVRDRVDEGSVRGVDDVQSEVVHPGGFDPEASLGSNTERGDHLDIEGGFSVVRDVLVFSGSWAQDALNGLSGKTVQLVVLDKIGSSKTFFGGGDHGVRGLRDAGVGDDEILRDIVEGLHGVWNVADTSGSELGGAHSSGGVEWWEVSHTSDDVDERSDVRGDGVLTDVAGSDVTGLDVDVTRHSGFEELLDVLDVGDDAEGISKVSDVDDVHGGGVFGLDPFQDGFSLVFWWGDEFQDLFTSPVLSVVAVLGVRDLPDFFRQDIDVSLFKAMVKVTTSEAGARRTSFHPLGAPPRS